MHVMPVPRSSVHLHALCNRLLLQIECLYIALLIYSSSFPLFPNVITKDAGNKIAALRLSVWQWIDNCSYHSLVLTLPLIHDYVKPIIYPGIIKFLFTLLLHSDTIL